MRWAGFGFTGLLYPLFAIALVASLGPAWTTGLAAALIALDGVGRMGAGLFACDPGCAGVSASQAWHHHFATLGFLSGVLAAIVWGCILRRRGDGLRWLGTYSIASGLMALALLMLMSWAGNPVQAPGLFEHLASAALSVWVLVFALCLLRRSGVEGRDSREISVTGRN